MSRGLRQRPRALASGDGSALDRVLQGIRKVWKLEGKAGIEELLGDRVLAGEHDRRALPDDETERETWRRDGALAIVHAVELGAKADRTLAAVSLLGRAGEREAARKALERAYAVADDDDTRDRVRAQLDKLDASAHADERERRRLAIEKRRVRTLPFVSPTTFLLVGPGSSPLTCVGPGSSARPECPTDWATALDEP